MLKKYSLKGGLATKEKAEREWLPLIEHAFKKAKENSKKYSARSLATEICLKVNSRLKKSGGYWRVNCDTFRKKIREDSRIVPHLTHSKQ
jgi:hypothetical protein